MGVAPPIPHALRRAHVHHVAIGSKSNIISKIPARMVRIVVEHDVVGVPDPVHSVRNVIRCDAELITGKPEAVRSSTFKTVNVARPDFCQKASMLPGSIETVVTIVAACVVADPSIVVCVNVRHFGMGVLVAKATPFFRLTLTEVFRNLSARRRWSSSHRLRTSGRNMPAADTSASMLFMLFMLWSLYRPCWTGTKQYQ